MNTEKCNHEVSPEKEESVTQIELNHLQESLMILTEHIRELNKRLSPVKLSKPQPDRPTSDIPTLADIPSEIREARLKVDLLTEFVYTNIDELQI